MQRKSFFNRQSPAVTLLIKGKSCQEILSAIRKAEYDGADAATVELCDLPLEERSTEMLQGIVSGTSLPVMFCLYRNDIYLGADDEARTKCLLNAAKSGAEVVDVMGDLFDPSPRELTANPEAIAKQKALIDEIHSLGCKVIISSHMPNEARTADQVLSHLQAQAERGADIVKIVTGINTEDDLAEAIRTDMMLNRTLKVPFVHVCGGSMNRLHRFIGPKLGSCIAFAVNDYEYPSLLYTQPTIRTLRAVLDNLPWHIDDAQKLN